MSDAPIKQPDGMALAKSMELLHRLVTDRGILASASSVSNYSRVWARDAVMCGLAGMLAGDEKIIAGLRASLETLATYQGPAGEIPSNVQFDEADATAKVSYGGLCGRVDAVLWFIIGVCQYVHWTNDMAFFRQMQPALQKCCSILDTWEFNRRGLIYVPQGGDWADEYILHGYVLYDQLLRVWALRGFAALANAREAAKQARHLAELIQVNYWPRRENETSKWVYHPQAFRAYLARQHKLQFGLASLTPGGYALQFDALANALSVLLHIPDAAQQASVLDHGQEILRSLPVKMVPAFWPPIQPGEPGWAELQVNFKDQFRNAPYQYHNGGVWPMVNGWWGMALCAANRRPEAQELFSALVDFNRQDKVGTGWGFYEYAHSRTGELGGTREMGWSAAATV
ncbi:MAG: fructofuranosidase/invertase, partial [Calditrichaeota bacterium]